MSGTHYWYYTAQNSLQQLGRQSRPANASSYSLATIDTLWVCVFCAIYSLSSFRERTEWWQEKARKLGSLSVLPDNVKPGLHRCISRRTFFQYTEHLAPSSNGDLPTLFHRNLNSSMTLSALHSSHAVHSWNDAPAQPTSRLNVLHVWKHIPVWATSVSDENEQNLTHSRLIDAQLNSIISLHSSELNTKQWSVMNELTTKKRCQANVQKS